MSRFEKILYVTTAIFSVAMMFIGPAMMLATFGNFPKDQVNCLAVLSFLCFALIFSMAFFELTKERVNSSWYIAVSANKDADSLAETLARRAKVKKLVDQMTAEMKAKQ